MGGTCRADTNYPSNLVHLCHSCHEWVESNRTQALADGWLIRQASPLPPSDVLVLLRFGSSYLTDQGGIAVEHPEDAAIRWAAADMSGRARRDRAA
ncbi:hypothetical protein UA75_14440 [Actinoalloteichus sp. GBA129-24]|nr:hypothetical protein UA75_14440 [Actinoalloteichus sp. GBA129-24]